MPSLEAQTCWYLFERCWSGLSVFDGEIGLSPEWMIYTTDQGFLLTTTLLENSPDYQHTVFPDPSRYLCVAHFSSLKRDPDNQHCKRFPPLCIVFFLFTSSQALFSLSACLCHFLVFIYLLIYLIYDGPLQTQSFPSWTSVVRDSSERELWLRFVSGLFMYFRLILSLISVCF